MPQPERLGPYRIGKPLGKGGMGTVYEAVNEETGERVAVKTLAPELAMAEGFRERFEAEIESLRTLRHPNIVRLYGYGEEDGLLFYSMELIEGISLEEELRAGRRFDWREVSRIAIQVSRALKHAHDHGIIHRDIKPANILLKDDKVKLADFGIAQLFGGTKLTTARGVVGTADYMSPEQAESRPITDRCDQYSLGCVMYTLLTGRPPFRAKSLPEMLQLQRYAEPEPVRRFAPDTPKQLEKVVMQLLEKSPKDRFPNALALAKHLEAMSLALSRPQPLDSDFELREHLPREPREPGDLAETPPEVNKADDADRLEYETLEAPTRGPSDMSVAESGLTSLPDSASQRHFTIVPDNPAYGRPESRPSWLVLTQAGVLLLLLGGVGWGVAWALRPATADQLFERISAAAEQGDQQLLAMEAEVNQFLDRFPGDPRAAEIEPLKQQLALAETERRMMTLLRRRDQSDSPLEALYLEAMRDAKDNPERAAEQLRSIIDLMAAGPATGVESVDHEINEAMLPLAKQQLERLDDRIADRAKTQLPFLQERLERARDLSSTDPLAAQALCRAIISFYQHRPWASGVVSDAQSLLSELDDEQ